MFSFVPPFFKITFRSTPVTSVTKQTSGNQQLSIRVTSGRFDWHSVALINHRITCQKCNRRCHFCLIPINHSLSASTNAHSQWNEFDPHSYQNNREKLLPDFWMGKIKYKANARKQIRRWEFMLLNGTTAYDRENQTILHIVEDVFDLRIASTQVTEICKIV